jgi:hypothetical protein
MTTREEEILRQICNNKRMSFDEFFIIDESLPLFIGRSLHPTPAEMAAVLDY